MGNGNLCVSVRRPTLLSGLSGDISRIMRLNLPRHNCIHLRILGQFTVSKDNDDKIQSFMDQTASRIHHDDEEDTHVAIFGSRSRIKGTTHRVRGSLSRSVGVGDVRSIRLSITNDRAPETLPRPPANMRPVSTLIEASSRLFGPIQVTCNAVFEYDESQGYRSKVRFPFRLIIPGDPAGVTHIEQAQFSRRVNDDVEYRISVSGGSPLITHSVGFETTVELDRKSVSQLFNNARSISSQFVMRTGGENDAPN